MAKQKVEKQLNSYYFKILV